jgi:hypothetical protein
MIMVTVHRPPECKVNMPALRSFRFAAPQGDRQGGRQLRPPPTHPSRCHGRDTVSPEHKHSPHHDHAARSPLRGLMYRGNAQEPLVFTAFDPLGGVHLGLLW